MTGTERGVFTGGVSLSQLVETGHLDPRDTPVLSTSELFTTMIHGGWPAHYAAPLKAARDHVGDYIDRIASYDVFEVSNGRERRPLGVLALLRSIARNVGQSPSLSTILADVQAHDSRVSRPTVERWIEALERLFVLERVEAWSPRLRSRARIRSTPVLYLADSSMVAHLLGATPDNLAQDLPTAGFIFENYVYQQLATYAEALGGRVHHYRDSNGREFDAVIVLDDGSWVGVEVKLGQGRIPEGIDSLTTTANDIDTDTLGKPRALILIVGAGSLAYTDPDSGVHVVPIQALSA